MITFDQAHGYQFALFFDEQPEASVDGLGRLAGLVARPTSGQPSLGLKFGAPDGGQSVIIQASSGSIAPSQVLSWRAGASVWRLMWGPSRLDLHFDARGYADLTDDLLSLERVSKRVMPNLTEVPSLLQQRLNRLALIVTGQATSTPGANGASRVVAATFFRQDLVEAVARGEIADAVARANRVTSWNLSNGQIVRVNRNETGTANWAVRNGVEETSLTWQWDVNTAAVPTTAFKPNSVGEFFARAEAWISERLAVLQEIS